jgi:hypothetical protein
VWKSILAVSVASLALAAAGSASDLPAGWDARGDQLLRQPRAAHAHPRPRAGDGCVAGSLTIHEADGSSVQVALAPDTEIVVDGRPGQVSDIRRGVTAVTQRIDGGAARLVKVHVPPRLLRLARR